MIGVNTPPAAPNETGWETLVTNDAADALFNLLLVAFPRCAISPSDPAYSYQPRQSVRPCACNALRRSTEPVPTDALRPVQEVGGTRLTFSVKGVRCVLRGATSMMLLVMADPALTLTVIDGSTDGGFVGAFVREPYNDIPCRPVCTSTGAVRPMVANPPVCLPPAAYVAVPTVPLRRGPSFGPGCFAPLVRRGCKSS